MARTLAGMRLLVLLVWDMGQLQLLKKFVLYLTYYADINLWI